MAMSPRLLRPTSTSVHPEANAWRTAVVANGGSVSAGTMQAVSKFCAGIVAAGLRDRFTRLNLFCGNDLTACRTPLYRAASATGLPLGNATDTNINFVDGDYAERGGTGGLKGNASTKYLETGLLQNINTGGHYSVYLTESESSSDNFRYWIGGSRYLLAAKFGAGTNALFVRNNTVCQSSVAGNALLGHFMGVNESTSSAFCYLNGVQDGTSTVLIATNEDQAAKVFTNHQTQSSVVSGARFAGYSMGATLTGTQAASFFSIMQAFQTSLGRNK